MMLSRDWQGCVVAAFSTATHAQGALSEMGL